MVYNEPLKKGSPVEPENTLLPWVDYLAYCKTHANPVVGHQLGFMWVVTDRGDELITTRKAMCHRCLRELWSPDPEESAES